MAASGAKPKVLYVLGGPGAGKGTLCEKAIENFAHWGHISAGDLLRAEKNNPESMDGELIREAQKEGKLVPSELTVKLIEKTMTEQQQKENKTCFLIDGYPRSLGNVTAWEKVIGDRADVLGALFIETNEEEMERRCLERGKTSGRADDNQETIRKRFKTYMEESLPIVKQFEEKGLVFKINGMPPIEDVWAVTKATIAKAEGKKDKRAAEEAATQGASSKKQRCGRPDANAVAETKQPPEPRREGGRDVLLMVGPSGVGKTTLIHRLMAEFQGSFAPSVSHTTRQPRAGEEDGVHYHFVEREEMKRKIAEGAFIEHAEVHGNFYGTSFMAVEGVTREGKLCILDVDVQGAQQVKKSYLDKRSVYVFVSAPSTEELEKRLRSRGTEVEEKIQTRLQNAKGEMGFMTENGGFFDKVLVNGDLDAAAGELKGFALEHLRLGQ